VSERREQFQSAHELSEARRCELLGVARSTAYYRGALVSAEDLGLIRLINQVHLALPFYGSRRIRDELDTRGQRVNRKCVQRLEREMGIRALYPKPRTTTPGKGHQSIQGTAYGMTKRVGGKTIITNVVEYSADEVNPPEGARSEDWIRSGFTR